MLQGGAGMLVPELGLNIGQRMITPQQIGSQRSPGIVRGEVNATLLAGLVNNLVHGSLMNGLIPPQLAAFA